MTPQEKALWNSVQRRAATMEPEIAAAMLRAFQNIRDSLTDAQITHLVEFGFSERIFQQVLAAAIIATALQPVRDATRKAIVQSFRYTARDLPKPPRDRTLTVAFDVLNPRVIDAIRDLETRVITTLGEEIRDTVRAHVENGLRDGTMAQVKRELRSVIGLAPNQEEHVRKYRVKLENAHLTKDALDNTLRDRRYDSAITKARATGVPLTAKEIDVRHAAYRRRMIAWNAETNARTATLNALKLGQDLSWNAAIDRGFVDTRRLFKTWIQVNRPNKREEHREMHGQTVPFNATYSNGERVPGQSAFNCACISRVFQRPAGR